MNSLRIARALTRILIVATTLTIGIATSASASSDPAPDWGTLAGENTVVVVTERPDGTPHETTVWIVVTGGRGYLRTSNTSWFRNIERNRNVVLRAGEREWALTVDHVEDDAEGKSVLSAFREKYGISDLLVAPMHLGGSHLLRLEPRLVR
jgi:hypothetical protein